MADDDNLVLRLLREIRAKQDTDGARLQKVKQRLQRVDRRLDEVKANVAMALGLAAGANLTLEERGERLDELQDQIEAPRRRVSHLEEQRL